MLALAVALSLLIGLSLGLLGGGGSILTVPILVYVLGVEAKEAIATSLVVVGITSLAASLQHARAGNVVWRTAFVFGAAGMAGAWLGGFAAGWLSGTTLLVLFGLMMVATGIAMLRGRKQPEGGPAPEEAHGQTWKIVLDGLVVGLVTGLVGAGGGFLVVPALVLLGGLPMQKAVGTSLVVIAMKSFAGYLGHATHVEIDWQLAGVVSASAVVGSLGGSWLAAQIRPEMLRKGFAGFVLVMAVIQLGMELA